METGGLRVKESFFGSHIPIKRMEREVKVSGGSRGIAPFGASGKVKGCETIQ